VLAGTGAFVYTQVAMDLDESLDAALRGRLDALAAAARAPRLALGAVGTAAIGDPEDSFAQVLGRDGRLIAAAGAARGPALDPGQLERARRGPLRLERIVAGIEKHARVLARPLDRRADPRVILAGQSMDDRDAALRDLAAAFAIGGPVAVLLASALGYGLATLGLAPVEAMRRRAAEVSLTRGDERLPLPAAHDEIRRLGETLNDMLGRLRRSFARERRFVADASHELRTPIAVVKTELEGALRTGDYGPGVRDALLAAVEECDHLAQLAEDLLVIARADEGRLPVRREPLEIRAVLEGVRDRFVSRAAEHGREIDVDAPAGLRADADPLRLRQALGNLVDNALRHGDGVVRLSARPADAGVRIDVSDAGGGFAPGIVGHAFERFAAGDPGGGERHAGLGLAIVRAVTEAHGGSAEIVASDGATVRLWLPGGAP
jgi:two-component system, OmpR family, sensor kinase